MKNLSDPPDYSKHFMIGLIVLTLAIGYILWTVDGLIKALVSLFVN